MISKNPELNQVSFSKSLNESVPKSKYLNHPVFSVLALKNATTALSSLGTLDRIRDEDRQR